MRRLFAALLIALAAWPAMALDPSEMLADPELEAIARKLDFEIRCVKCQSEAIASSNADWARDARRAVRELIAEGRSPDEVRAYFVERYGDYALMRPSTSGTNLILWIAGPVMLLGAGGLAFSYLRTRSTAQPASEVALSAEEQARLDELLNSDKG